MNYMYRHSMNGGRQIITEVEFNRQSATQGATHAILLILAITATYRECRISQPYEDAELVTHTKREFGSPTRIHQMFPTTLRLRKPRKVQNIS